jgi:hypothetical protein
MAVVSNSYTHTGFFSQSAVTSLLKNKDYFTSSFIFLSLGDDSVTTIAATTATQKWTHLPACCRPQLHSSLLSRSKMHLPPPMPRSLLFGHGNPSSGRRPLLRHCQPLPSHSCLCQPLLAFTAFIDGWLLHPSLLHNPLPTLLSATPIIDTFIAGCHAILFLICAILSLIAPLPPSMVVIPPAIAFNPCTPLCPSCSLVWTQQ